MYNNWFRLCYNHIQVCGSSVDEVTCAVDAIQELLHQPVENCMCHWDLMEREGADVRQLLDQQLGSVTAKLGGHGVTSVHCTTLGVDDGLIEPHGNVAALARLRRRLDGNLPAYLAMSSTTSQPAK